MLSRVKNFFRHICTHRLAYTFLVLVIYRVLRVERKYGAKTDTEGYFLQQALIQDSLLVGACLAVYVISLFVPYKPIRRLLRFSVFLCFLVYAMDVVIYKVFGMRLMLEDILKYFRDSADVFSVAFQFVSTGDGILITMVSIGLTAIYLPFITRSINISRRNGVLLGGLSLMLLGTGVLAENSSYCHNWVYKNVVSVNLTNPVNTDYSEQFEQTVLEEYGGGPVTVLPQKGLNQRKNIVIVVIESLSAYHSAFFSGLKNYTPELDAIAEKHISYTQYYANGYTTEGGLIALLVGEPPVPSPNVFTVGAKGLFAFNGFYDPERSVPMLIKKFGYRSEFITTGRTTFSNKNEWLENIGFDVVEGAEHPFYDTWPRFHFDAAPDEALYLRLLEKISQASPQQPYLFFVETVSTHFPFRQPETDERTEESVIRYADRQLGAFVARLTKTGFFKDGILIITSDHRAMVPVKDFETDAYGSRATAMIPFVVMTGKEKETKRIDRPFQQTDLLNSLECMISAGCTSDPFTGVMFARQPVSPRFITHVNGEDRSVVNVFTPNGGGMVCLDGDDTSICDGELPEYVVDKINYDRIKKSIVHSPASHGDFTAEN